MEMTNAYQTPILVMRDTYNKIVDLFKDSPYKTEKIISGDLGPLLFLLGDLAREKGKKDRHSFALDVREWRENNYIPYPDKTFNDRVIFYLPFVFGKEAIQYYNAGEISHDGNYETEILFAFCDLVRCPELLEHYGVAVPASSADAVRDEVYIRKVVLPLQGIITEFTNTMMIV